MSTSAPARPLHSGHLLAIWVITFLAATGSIALRLVSGGLVDTGRLDDSIKHAARLETWADLLATCTIVGFFAALVLGGIRTLLMNLFPTEAAAANESDSAGNVTGPGSPATLPNDADSDPLFKPRERDRTDP